MHRPATAPSRHAAAAAAETPAERLWRPWAVLLAFVALAALLFEGAWRNPTGSHVGFLGDPEQAMWMLRHLPWALAHHQDPLTTTRIGFPDGANLMWNTSIPLAALVLSPVTLLLGPVLAFNLLLTLEVALTAWAGALALRRWTGGNAGAVAGGLLYGFSPYMLPQATGHANLVAAFLPPLLLLLLDDGIIRRRTPPLRAGVLLGLCAGAQLLLSEELLASEAVAAVVLLAVLAALRPAEVRQRVEPALRVVGGALAVFAVIAAVPLYVQLHGLRIEGPIRVPDRFVTDLLEPVVPSSQLLQPQAATDLARGFADNFSEADGYLGAPLMLVLGWTALRHRRRLVVQAAALTGVVLVVLSLGPSLQVGGHLTGVPLPWRLLRRLPLLGNLLPGRLMLYADLAAALLLGLFVEEAWRARRRLAAAGPAALLLAATVASLLPALPFPTTAVDVPAYFTGGAVVAPPDGSVLVVPFAQDGGVTATPMLWQAEAGMAFAMPDGYFLRPDAAGHSLTGPLPTQTSLALRRILVGDGPPPLTDDLRREMAEDFRIWQVRAVLVGPMPHRDDAVAFVGAVLGRGPEPGSTDDVAVWTGVSAADVAPH